MSPYLNLLHLRKRRHFIRHQHAANRSASAGGHIAHSPLENFIFIRRSTQMEGLTINNKNFSIFLIQNR